MEVLFENQSSSSCDGDNLNSKAAAEAQVLVRAAKSHLYFTLWSLECDFSIRHGVSVMVDYNPPSHVTTGKKQKNE